MIRMTVPPKTDLERMYVVDKKSTKRIADKYNCAPSTVLKWLHIHDIPMHTPKSRRDDPMKRRLPQDNDGAGVCGTLKQHAEDLKDDPERLSTEFMQNLIGTRCNKEDLT